MKKTYKSVDEQIEYLKDNKKIIVKNEHKQIFEERSYSSLINPYKEFFSNGRDEKGNHIYINEIDFEEILKIVKVDDNFCTAMYSYIGSFEKKFKTVLFSEICSKYVNSENEDKYCTSYIEEIDRFLESGNFDDLPRFCANYPFILTKNGYVEDQYNLDCKKDLLIHLKEIGTGVSRDGGTIEKSNQLISHYLKTQVIAPLWVLPNSLTLGELKILFSMLDSNSQKKIISKFYDIEDYGKISLAKILNFSGALEIIRRIRNAVNHYEPIFPLLVSELKPMKKVKESQIYAVFKLLSNTFASSSFNHVTYVDLKLKVNDFNLKYIKIFEVMQEFTQK